MFRKTAQELFEKKIDGFSNFSDFIISTTNNSPAQRTGQKLCSVSRGRRLSEFKKIPEEINRKLVTNLSDILQKKKI